MRWLFFAFAAVAIAALVSVFVISRVMGDRGLARSERPADAAASRAAEIAELLSKAQAAEDKGELGLAILAYDEASKLAPTPEHSIRIATLYERLGKRDEARVYLQRYLDAAPNAPDRPAITARIAALEPISGLDASVVAVRPPEPPTSSKPRSHPTPAQQYCQCTSRHAPNGASMCARPTAAPRCRCEARLTLCAEPLVKCRDGNACDYQVDKGYTCLSGLGAFVTRGAPGDPCSGYSSAHGDTEPIAGVLECNFCIGEAYWQYRGHENDPCTGYSSSDGKRYEGQMISCVDESQPQ